MKKHRAPNMGVSKNRGIYPEMDGKNNGKPYLMDGLGVPLFTERPTSAADIVHPH